jgi:hypothetical protein
MKCLRQLGTPAGDFKAVKDSTEAPDFTAPGAGSVLDGGDGLLHYRLMSTNALPLSAFALETCVPPVGARAVGQTLTVRLRLAGSDRSDAMSGTLVLGDGCETVAGALHAAVVDAPGNALTVTL